MTVDVRRAPFGSSLEWFVEVSVPESVSASVDVPGLVELAIPRVPADDPQEADPELCSAVLESAGCLVLVLDQDDRLLRWNAACVELTGYRQADVADVDAIVCRLVPPDEAEPVRQAFAEVRRGSDHAVTFVCHWRGAAGRQHLITWSLVRVERAGRVMIICTGLEVPDDEALRATLRVSEERFRLLAESMPDLVYRFRFTPQRHFEYVNPACVRFTGYTPQELYERADLAPGLMGRRVRGGVEDTPLEDGQPRLVRWLRRDGSLVWAEHRTSPILDPDGAVVGVQGIVADVTERVLGERIAEAQARILELVARGNPLWQTQTRALEVLEGELPGTIAVLVEQDDVGRCRVLAAPAVPDVVGELADPRLGQRLAAIARRPRGDAMIDADLVLPTSLAELVTGRRMRSVWTVPVAGGEEGRRGYVVVLAARSTVADSELVVLGTLSRLLDIAAERDRAQRALAHQALHDGLTGLANRALSETVLENALARSGSHGHTVAVLFCDLDRFKNVNDSLGHSAGDALLVAVAERLRNAAGRDVVVARTGGDEFTVIHSSREGVAGAAEAARRLVAAMEEPFHVLGRQVYASMSVGVAVAAHGATAEGLIRDADAAMYRAKDRGGRRFEMFDTIMQVRARERLELETGLHSALARRELVLQYQPQVQLGTGAVVGAEALLRWNHGGRWVSPSDFIPIAEETGLIVPIGAWVLHHACAVGARVAARSPGFQVAVNLSARQLADPMLTEHVSRALALSGLPPDQLCLEVTETTLMDDAPAAMATLQTVHELGVTFAIDDFGTGYSSLLYLKRLPVSALKIDGSFIQGLGRHSDDEAIVASTIQLGHSLGRDVIGEGVETEAQHAHLEALGCRLGQGYRFGRAAGVEALPMGA